jgi:putative transposase
MRALPDKVDFRNSFSKGSSNLRKGRHSIENQIYLVTFNTINREPLFNNFEPASQFCKHIQTKEIWPSAKLLCWVLMPDHFHGLIHIDGSEPLKTIIGRVKAQLTRSIKVTLPNHQDLWQKGFHDRALRKDEDLQNVARYIVMNPIRAKLCRRIGDYPYWNAIWLEPSSDQC